MEHKTQIVMIAAEQLQHHPDSPRKTIKDLEELAASIKANGIMQNLTVVPVPDNENEYYIVIGNRRFEAGKIAGISHYPCVISNMDYGKQLETMLIENMQRSDLTIIEQAEGFEQLTLNGFSIEDISNKTGFSQSTVRRRLSVASLEKEKVEKAFENGATLDEFVKIANIKNKKAKKILLTVAGTNSFNWRYEHFMKWQRAEGHIESTKKALLKFAKETEKELAWSCRHSIVDLTLNKIAIPVPTQQEQDENEFYFYLEKDDYNIRFIIFKKSLNEDESKQEPKESAEEIENRKRHESIEALCNDFNAAVTLFICEKAIQKSIPGIEKAIIKSLSATSKSGSIRIDYGDVLDFYADDIEYDEDDEIGKQILEFVQDEENYESSEDVLTAIENIIPDGYLFGIYAQQFHSYRGDYINYDNLVYNNYRKTDAPIFKSSYERIKLMYQFICDLGYRMSDEEKELINGTHKLYNQQESEG